MNSCMCLLSFTSFRTRYGSIGSNGPGFLYDSPCTCTPTNLVNDADYEACTTEWISKCSLVFNKNISSRTPVYIPVFWHLGLLNGCLYSLGLGRLRKAAVWTFLMLPREVMVMMELESVIFGSCVRCPTARQSFSITVQCGNQKW
jgi:hypothetical protein